MKLEKHQLQAFADLIKDEVGIVYSETNFFQLETRLTNFRAEYGLASFDDLLREVKQNKQSLLSRALFDLTTNNETSFFRDKGLFDNFEQIFLPQWFTKHGAKDALDIWSAASSSGQEIYSLGMILNQFKKSQVALRYKLYASDYSDKMYNRVRAGVYSQIEVQRGLSTVKLLKYFDKQENQNWKVKPELQEGLDVFQANLLNPLPKALKCDVVFLRNVLIYHTPDNKTDIVKRIANCLKPEGFLVLGAAENLFGISSDFNQLKWGTTIVYQKKGTP